MRKASPAPGVTLSRRGGRGKGVDDKPRSEGGFNLGINIALFNFD